MCVCERHLSFLFHILLAHFFAPAIVAKANCTLPWPCLKCVEHLLFVVGLLCHHHTGCLQKPTQLFWHRHRLGHVREFTLTDNLYQSRTELVNNRLFRVRYF